MKKNADGIRVTIATNTVTLVAQSLDSAFDVFLKSMLLVKQFFEKKPSNLQESICHMWNRYPLSDCLAQDAATVADGGRGRSYKVYKPAQSLPLGDYYSRPMVGLGGDMPTTYIR